jgi:LytS/YehU family sensor histidine kinase
VAVGLSLATGTAWYLVYSSIAVPVLWIEQPLRWEEAALNVLQCGFVLLVWSGGYFALRRWRRAELAKRRALEARVLTSEARFEALTDQLNPRFLFDVLTSIQKLIEEKPARAGETAKRLSEFLQHTLANPPFEETLLAKEVEALRAYLAIEDARFEEKLDVDIHVTPDAAASRVPALVLHPLVENAVKYGEPDESRALRVKLRAHRDNGQLFVQVANTGRLSGVRSSSNGTCLGLDNIRKRLDHFYPDSHSFQIFDQDGWVYAVVEIHQRARESAVA